MSASPQGGSSKQRLRWPVVQSQPLPVTGEGFSLSVQKTSTALFNRATPQKVRVFRVGNRRSVRRLPLEPQQRAGRIHRCPVRIVQATRRRSPDFPLARADSPVALKTATGVTFFIGLSRSLVALATHEPLVSSKVGEEVLVPEPAFGKRYSGALGHPQAGHMPRAMANLSKRILLKTATQPAPFSNSSATTTSAPR